MDEAKKLMSCSCLIIQFLLSKPEGDALLTNAEVMHWLKEQKIDASNDELESEGRIPPPENAASVGRELLTFFSTAPSANQTVETVKKLFDKLAKYKLSEPEKVMIANIRPDAYAHITPLIADIYNRFDEDTIYEIIEVVKSTLEPRPKIYDEETENQDNQPNADDEYDDGNEGFEPKHELMEIEDNDDPAIQDMDLKPAKQS